MENPDSERELKILEPGINVIQITKDEWVEEPPELNRADFSQARVQDIVSLRWNSDLSQSPITITMKGGSEVYFNFYDQKEKELLRGGPFLVRMYYCIEEGQELEINGNMVSIIRVDIERSTSTVIMVADKSGLAGGVNTSKRTAHLSRYTFVLQSGLYKLPRFRYPSTY